jgi:hypothetical protein
VSQKIWFEIKQQRPRRSEEETQELLARAIYTTNNVGTELLFKNHWFRVWDFYLEAGEGDPTLPHHYVLDYVFVRVCRTWTTAWIYARWNTRLIRFDQ